MAIGFQGELEAVVFIRNHLHRLRTIKSIYLNVGKLANYDARKRTALRPSVRVRARKFFTLLAVVSF